VALAQVYSRPDRLTPEQARAAISASARSPGFLPTLRATAGRHYRSTGPIGAPVTVAFGSRDRLLLRRDSRHIEQLPAGAEVVALPGCGHVPMSDDPAAVADLLASAARRASTTE
jgi:pimeloyl-ACP methyl ester carboxylesterase